MIALRYAVKAPDHQNIFAHCSSQVHAGNVQPHLARQSHGNELGFDHAVKIIAGRKLGDVLLRAVVEQHFGPCAPERCAVEQCLIELGQKRNSLLHLFGCGLQFFE